MLECLGYLGLLFVIAFLLGSIPWGVIISRIFYHTDVREHGSGNIGTTNAMRTLGKVGGSAVFVLDFGKGVLSGVIATIFAARTLYCRWSYRAESRRGICSLSYNPNLCKCCFFGLYLGTYF